MMAELVDQTLHYETGMYYLRLRDVVKGNPIYIYKETCVSTTCLLNSQPSFPAPLTPGKAEPSREDAETKSDGLTVRWL